MGNVKRTTQVKVIRVKGQAALVEYAGNRAIIPETAIVTKLSDTFVANSDLEAAIPYGIDWEEELDEVYSITRSELINKLHEAGIWTYADFVRSPDAVIGALHSAFGMTFSSIAVVAKRSRSNNL